MSKMNTISCYALVLATLFSNLALFSSFVESKAFDQTVTTSSKIVNITHDKYNGTFENSKAWKTSCRDAQIQVSQGTISMTGIPRYSVTITNLCSSCSVAQVHLHCGMFASANVVNPNLFKRIGNDDCLVNGGNAIASGKTIEFEYSNTRSYPLSVASYVCSA